mgnify:FL=1
MSTELARERAVREAIKYLEGAEVIGVGTGSTVEKLINLMRESKELHNKCFLASSIDTALKLKRANFKVLNILSTDHIDVYVDSADKVDLNLNMIKGGGAALTMEKLLAYYSKLNIFIIDYSKLVKSFSSNDYVPVDVLPCAVNMFIRHLSTLGYECVIRTSGKGKYGPVVSDVGGVIVDVRLHEGLDLIKFNNMIRSQPGVIETGLFIGLSDIVLVGYEDGVEVLRGVRTSNS